jgi:glutathione S-transferase
MITVHHLERSRSQRVLWLLEELGLPYELERYARHPKTMLAPRELRAIHPLGKSPVISDGVNTVAESAAILEYLLDRHDREGPERLRPAPDTPAYLRYRYFLHYAEGSLMPLMLLTLVFARMPKGPLPFFLKPLVRRIAAQGLEQFVGPQVGLHLAFLERELDGKRWLLGDALSAADIQLSFPLEAAAVRGGLDARYPNLAAYLQRIRERPAYQRALAAGGPVVSA